MNFKKNLSGKGRLIRLAIALVLLVLGLYYSNRILIFASLFTFMEAIFSWCFLFALLKIKEKKCKK